MDELVKLFWFIPGLIFVGLPFAVFARLEEVASPEFKTNRTAWLLRLDTSTVAARLPLQFARLFDYVFGKRHFSVKCCLRSCVASVLFALLILSGMYLIGGYDPKVDPILQSGNLFFICVLALSLIPDYICLLKTRYAIRLMQKSGSLLIIGLIFVVDLLLVPVVWWIANLLTWGLSSFLLGNMFLHLISDLGGANLADEHGITTTNVAYFAVAVAYVLSTILLLVPIAGAKFSLVVFFLAEFLTSIWALLYVCAALIARSLARSQRFTEWILWAIDVREKPLRSIGMVGSAIIALILCVVAAVPSGTIGTLTGYILVPYWWLVNGMLQAWIDWLAALELG